MVAPEHDVDSAMKKFRRMALLAKFHGCEE
jgi:hypothetical protein